MNDTTITLSMKFETREGKAKTVTVRDCRPDVTAAEAEGVMDAMIDSGVFDYDPVGRSGAQIIERKVTVLF